MYTLHMNNEAVVCDQSSSTLFFVCGENNTTLVEYVFVFMKSEPHPWNKNCTVSSQSKSSVWVGLVNQSWPLKRHCPYRIVFPSVPVTQFGVSVSQRSRYAMPDDSVSP